MPFGSMVLPDGGVRFRLWAPAAKSVSLCLYAGGDCVSDSLVLMKREDGGCFTLSVPPGSAGAGSRYHFLIDDEIRVPDPASRFQPEDVHGPSEVIDPAAWHWQDVNWHGRTWEEAVIYELHVGAFTAAGTFSAVTEQLDYLRDLGITVIELMPVADFPGQRNWGYDGVLPYAPDSRYGRPDELKALVEAAHRRGLMVLLDVVYNHFGPEGNYLHRYAPQFYDDVRTTPWGESFNFSGRQAHWVRRFFIHNALYWLEEYNLDGLRLDAVHAIADSSRQAFLDELAGSVADYFPGSRKIHLVLENDGNNARYLARNREGKPLAYSAQWNDDFHHCLHVILTGETNGYYRDYVSDPVALLGRCLSEGFAYQGDISPFRHHSPRGEPSGHLPPAAFIVFLQNHDQVGNRPNGERIASLVSYAPLRAATALMLLSPYLPLIFMGQEWGCRKPFPFFCDFDPALHASVREGRLAECTGNGFPGGEVPDPCAEGEFNSAVLDRPPGHETEYLAWHFLHRHLLGLRQRHITGRLKGTPGAKSRCNRIGDRALAAGWHLGDGSILTLLANLGDAACRLNEDLQVSGRLIYTTHPRPRGIEKSGKLPPWSVFWFLQAAGNRGEGRA